MRKINFLMFILLLSTGMIFSQKANVDIYKTSTAPVIDGAEDDVWKSVQSVAFNKALAPADLPTPAEGSFKVMYNDTALFVLVTYADDDHFPFHEKDGSSGFENYNMDHVEIYMDVNDELIDGKGPNDASSGNYSADPGFDKDMNGILSFGGGWSGHTVDRYYAYKMTGEGYTMEIAIPYSENLVKNTGEDFVPATGSVMGFDVVVVDRDEYSADLGRQRLMWQNNNTDGKGDPWMNMDACGTLTLKGNAANAGKANVDIYRTSTAPVLDGIEDDVWKNITATTINKALAPADLPTPEEGSFKVMYNDTALFVLVTYADDDHFPFHEKDGSSGFENYNMDHIEIYMDVNDVLNDGKGPNDASSGNYSADPGFDKDMNGILSFGGGWSGHTVDRYYAYKLTGEGYTMEIAIPYSENLVKNTGEDFVPATGNVMGFDVVIVDRDEYSADLGRQRLMWQNNNTDGKGDPWMNMDACGTITLQGVKTGLNPLKATNSVKVYPNPATNFVTIDGQFSKAVIIDITGQVVMEGITNEFNVSTLYNGLYLINLYSNNELVGSGKFLKR